MRDEWMWLAALALVGALQVGSPPARGAESPAVSLQNARLVEFARLVWSEVLREDYIFDGAFLADTSEISVDVRALAPEEARRLVVETAEGLGFVVTRRGRVSRFGKPRPQQPEDHELFFYRPRHRSVGYLSELLSSLFPGGSFSFQRGAPSVVGRPPGESVQPGGQQSRQDALGRLAGLPAVPQGLIAPQALPAPVMPSSAADHKADAFVFRGPRRDVERLQGLLAQVDVAPAELVVRAVVYEVRRSVADSAALSIAASVLGGSIGVTYGAAPLPNSLLVSVGGFRAVVSALSTDGRFRAVSSPTLRVQSGQSARFVVGDETPVLGNVSFTQTGQPVQSVEYRPSGVIFELKPVAREEVVELDVKQQLSSFAVTTSGVNNSPTLLKREVQTVVGVRPGETVVIGGLEDARSSEDRSGLGFLPRWMDSRGRSEDRTELLLVLDVARVGRETTDLGQSFP